MRNTLQSSLFDRWFEELCRIKHYSLRTVVSTSGERLASKSLPDKGGVYTFWWTGQNSILKSQKCNRNIALKGPSGKPVTLIIDDTWLGIDSNLPIPLYVGKTAANISVRIGKHLMLNSKRMFPLGLTAMKRKAPTTTCQLRAGIEHMFPTEKDTRNMILDNVGLSYIELHEEANSANRFYLEDLAIGRMKPAINVDVER